MDLRNSNALTIAAITATAFVLLTFVSLGQGVHVLGDEWTYSTDAQFTSPGKATYPVWLYLSIFSGVGNFGTGFFQAARMINAIIFVASVPFIYETAKHYTTARWALLIAALSAFAPISSYAAYFMPDATYFTAFWVVTWFVLTQDNRRSLLYGVGIGALTGLTTLIKPHGLFLLAGIVATRIVIAAIRFDGAETRRASLTIVTTIAAFAVVRFGIGYLFAGPAALSLFGAYSQWTTTEWTPEKISSALNLAWLLARYHAIGIAIWVGPGLVAAVSLISRSDIKHLSLVAYMFCVGGLFLLISVAFSVRIADGAPALDALRLHMRYYNAIFPLLPIIAAAAITSSIPNPRNVTRVAAVLVAVPTLFFIGPFLQVRPITYIDAPEVYGLITSGVAWRITIALLMTASILAMALMPKAGAICYLVVAMPIAVVISSVHVQYALTNRAIILPSDKAGSMARDIVGKEADRLIIIGDAWSMLNVRFLLNTPGIADVGMPESHPIEPHWIPPASLWLLILDARPRPAGWVSVWDDAEGWSLLKRS